MVGLPMRAGFPRPLAAALPAGCRRRRAIPKKNGEWRFTAGEWRLEAASDAAGCRFCTCVGTVATLRAAAPHARRPGCSLAEACSARARAWLRLGGGLYRTRDGPVAGRRTLVPHVQWRGCGLADACSARARACLPSAGRRPRMPSGSVPSLQTRSPHARAGHDPTLVTGYARLGRRWPDVGRRPSTCTLTSARPGRGVCTGRGTVAGN